MKVSVTKVALTDGSNRLEGIVRNVSNTGIEVSLDTELVDPHAAKCTLQLSHQDRDCRIAAIPRWQKMDSDGNIVGMRICEAPRNWISFVDSIPASRPKKR